MNPTAPRTGRPSPCPAHSRRRVYGGGIGKALMARWGKPERPRTLRGTVAVAATVLVFLTLLRVTVAGQAAPDVGPLLSLRDHVRQYWEIVAECLWNVQHGAGRRSEPSHPFGPWGLLAAAGGLAALSGYRAMRPRRMERARDTARCSEDHSELRRASLGPGNSTAPGSPPDRFLRSVSAVLVGPSEVRIHPLVLLHVASIVAVVVLAFDGHVPEALLSAAMPLAAWYAAGRLGSRRLRPVGSDARPAPSVSALRQAG